METQPCSFVYVLCMATFVLKLQLSSRSGDCNGPQSLNYLLSGLLQIMCTYHCLKLSRGCPYACRSHLCGVKILPLSEGFLWPEHPGLSEVSMGSSPSPMTVDKYPSSHIPHLGIFHTNCQKPPWVSSWVVHSVNCFDETPFTDFPFHLAQCFLKSPPKSTRIFAQSMLLGEVQMKTNVNYSCIYIT